VSSTQAQDPRVISAGVDWITATSRKGTRGTLLSTLANRWRDLHEAEGHQVKAWRWEGYDGHTMDSLSVGTRPDGTIVRLSGDLARQRAPQLLSLADNVSRIDVQVTIQETDLCVNHARRGMAAAKQDRRVKAGMCTTSFITSTPEGSTAYIGSRASERYFRIYDKSAESKHAYPPGCWRFEVEYKGKRAFSVGERMRRLGRSAEGCRCVVVQAFLDYGVIIPAPHLPTSWRDTSPRMETTDERRLRWLESSIAPVVSRMMESLDRPTVMEALGIILESPDGVIDTSTGEMESQ
jgi:hypothetical protein